MHKGFVLHLETLWFPSILETRTRDIWYIVTGSCIRHHAYDVYISRPASRRKNADNLRCDPDTPHRHTQTQHVFHAIFNSLLFLHILPTRVRTRAHPIDVWQFRFGRSLAGSCFFLCKEKYYTHTSIYSHTHTQTPARTQYYSRAARRDLAGKCV